MRRIREWLLTCGVMAVFSSVSMAQEASEGKAAFGPIPIYDAYGRLVPAYRNPYGGPFNRQLDKLGDKMRAAGMHGGLVPLYYPPSASGFGYYGYGFGSGYGPGAGNGGFGSPLYHPVSASTGPGLYYSPIFNSLPGTPLPQAAANGWGFSPPWSKAYRQGQPREHKLFGHHQD